MPNKPKPSDDTFQMPQNIEAERSVLGGVLVDNKYLAIAAEIVRPEDFYQASHHHIFDAMLAMADKHISIDLVTVCDELHTSGDLEVAGGAAYISSLMDGVPKVTNVGHYATIVRERAILRRLLHTAHNIQQHILDGSDDVNTIVEKARTSITTLADKVQAAASGGLIEIERVIDSSYEQIAKIFEGGRSISGLATGYDDLDALTLGLQASDLIIVAARPSVGKTALCLNIAENIARKPEQKPLAIFSLEMSKTALLMRLIASQARVDAHKFRTGHLSKDDLTAITQSLLRISEYSIWIDDSASNTVLDIAIGAKKLKREKGLGLVMVDYIQLLSTGKRHNSRQEEVSEISRSLKAMAKELEVPVLVLSQLTRAPQQEGRMPQLSDLRESGAIEQDADVVIFIHRPNLYKSEATDEERAQTDLIVAKQRNGPTDRLPFVFLGRYTRFEPAATKEWSPTLGGPEE